MAMSVGTQKMQIYTSRQVASISSPGIIQLGALHGIIQCLLVFAQVHIANCPVEVCFGVVGVFLDGFAVLPTFQIV